MTTSKQDREFGEKVLSLFDVSDLLAESVMWIGENMSPEDVFDESTLEEWAAANNFVLKE